jgi:hypothetical protein
MAAPKKTPRAPEEKPFLDAHDVASILDVHVGTVIKWRQRNMGPTYTQVCGRVRYPRADFFDWLESQTKRPGGRAA